MIDNHDIGFQIEEVKETPFSEKHGLHSILIGAGLGLFLWYRGYNLPTNLTGASVGYYLVNEYMMKNGHTIGSS